MKTSYCMKRILSVQMDESLKVEVRKSETNMYHDGVRRSMIRMWIEVGFGREGESHYNEGIPGHVYSKSGKRCPY